MEQEKLYVIEVKTYEAHIDEEVHLYGLLHQLAFLAGKIKDRRDMENLIDTAFPVLMRERLTLVMPTISASSARGMPYRDMIASSLIVIAMMQRFLRVVFSRSGCYRPSGSQPPGGSTHLACSMAARYVLSGWM